MFQLPRRLLPQSRRDARRERARWDTWPQPKAKVLCVARTLTSATRLLDIEPLVLREDEIETYYTVNPGSVFTEGLDLYLSQLGLGDRLLTWREARARSFDLAIACSVHPSMRKLDAPLMVMPHGAGYNRLVTESTSDTSSPAGLSRNELTWRGKVVPAAIGLSHEDQLARLAETCPEAVPSALVVGDRCFDRIQRSLVLRDDYRERLGVYGGRQLVVVHTTWSEHSLIGQHPGLPLELVTSLPVDEFAVAAVLHPNVWARHSERGVRHRLEPAMDAGLLVIPPEEGWRAAVVASDLVVGDHGSTSLYSAAAGRAVLLAATGVDELDPSSATAEFSQSAPRLDPRGDLYAQLRQAAQSHDPTALQPALERQLGARGEGGTLVQERIYSFLYRHGIHAPSHTPDPAPVPAAKPLHHQRLHAYDVTGTVRGDGAVELQRLPVRPRRRHEEAEGFYAVAYENRHLRCAQSAEVVARMTVDGELEPVEWLRATSAKFTGVRVLAAALDATSCVVGLCDGRLLEARTERPWGARRARLDPLLLGAALNLWLYGDARPKELPERLWIRTGGSQTQVALVPPP